MSRRLVVGLVLLVANCCCCGLPSLARCACLRVPVTVSFVHCPGCARSLSCFWCGVVQFWAVDPCPAFFFFGFSAPSFGLRRCCFVARFCFFAVGGLCVSDLPGGALFFFGALCSLLFVFVIAYPGFGLFLCGVWLGWSSVAGFRLPPFASPFPFRLLPFSSFFGFFSGSAGSRARFWPVSLFVFP